MNYTLSAISHKGPAFLGYLVMFLSYSYYFFCQYKPAHAKNFAFPSRLAKILPENRDERKVKIYVLWADGA